MSQVVVLALQRGNCTGLAAGEGEHEYPLAYSLSLNNQTCPNYDHDHLAMQASGQVGFADLQNQIDVLQHPVCVEVTFDTTDGQALHYCVINGVFVQDGEPWVSILDPGSISPGEKRMPFSDFASGKIILQSDTLYPATWTDTFYTK